jgi:hypothetical protein
MSEAQARAAESGAEGVAAPAARGGRRSARRAAGGQVAPQRASTSAGTVTMQARVDAGFARELEADAAVLGLRSASELVREGLRLVHKQARELAMAASYEEFYAGKPAPVSQVTAALWPE